MKTRSCSRFRFFLPCIILVAGWLIPYSLLSQDVQQTEARMMKQAEENIEKYRKGNVTIQFKSRDGKMIKNAKVDIHQKTHDFLFGCIIFDLIGNENNYKPDLFRERFKNIFNLAVFPFYWPGYESRQGFTQWEDMLKTIDWCEANGITTKGHPLVWATQSGTPQWLKAYTVNETEELLKTRVINITAGFRDKIELWDVVNEPVNVKTWKHKIQSFDDEHDWGVADTISLIADYVEQALKWAHQGNPKATLLINEYQTLANQDVRKRYDDLLAELKKRNAPVSGFGIQAHEPRQEWFSPVEVWKTFDLYSRFGYPIHITEFHPQSSGVPITGGWRTGNWTPEAQAEFTEQFVKLCFGHPALASINWWGFSDRNIWLPGGGLVDEEYRPKPVYLMLNKLINHPWKTNMSTQTDNQGTVSFRGFFGEYDIDLIRSDGRTFSFYVHVSKNKVNGWVFLIDGY
ncbi:MAG: glycoside hydrolase family 10 [Bacteroidales bacterium]|nr:glycoside hydrolase family 10 [Bacteroidales bacterium]